MIVRIPLEMQNSIITLLQAVLGVVVFLWGYAVRKNQENEDYKLSEYKKEKLSLREENQKLKMDNKNLAEQNVKYKEYVAIIKNAVDQKDY